MSFTLRVTPDRGKKNMTKEQFLCTVDSILVHCEAQHAYHTSSAEKELNDELAEHDPELARMIRDNHASIGAIVDHIRRRMR